VAAESYRRTTGRGLFFRASDVCLTPCVVRGALVAAHVGRVLDVPTFIVDSGELVASDSPSRGAGGVVARVCEMSKTRLQAVEQRILLHRAAEMCRPAVDVGGRP
jgi:hypothetical protein